MKFSSKIEIGDDIVAKRTIKKVTRRNKFLIIKNSTYKVVDVFYHDSYGKSFSIIDDNYNLVKLSINRLNEKHRLHSFYTDKELRNKKLKSIVDD